MGLLVFFFNLAVECFDVLAWPLFALGYPIWASIQAIETNSISEIRKLITYWVSLSLILIFEELLKIPEWIPFWHLLKLILVGCLVAPYFDGSVYVYKHIIRPCLSADPQVVINMFIKLKELFLEKYNLLVVIERDVIKEHEPEALKNLIAFKPRLEAHEVEKNDISAVEIKEKKETASAKKIGTIHPDLAPAVDRVRAAKDLTASMASCRDVFPDTPPCRSISNEWTCPICQLTATSEEVFISHLQGKRHKAASKKLKAKNQIIQSQNSSLAEAVAPKEIATAMEVGRDVPNKQSKGVLGVSPGIGMGIEGNENGNGEEWDPEWRGVEGNGNENENGWEWDPELREMEGNGNGNGGEWDLEWRELEGNDNGGKWKRNRGNWGRMAMGMEGNGIRNGGNWRGMRMGKGIRRGRGMRMGMRMRMEGNGNGNGNGGGWE